MTLNVLWLDLNSFFATAEQQLHPELRGKPVAVAPVTSSGGCCIAASIEAKRFGVKTGTRVAEARQLCPDITILPSRPRIYIHFHHEVIAALERCLPVQAVRSIDEASCRLLGAQRERAAAADLARRIKHSIREHAGDYLSCSIGIAPNAPLAKLASDLQKPDGLVIIEQADLPERLLSLNLTDLPGIGERTALRLEHHGIRTIAHLYALDERQMADVWKSVIGRYWWHWLRGHDLPDLHPTVRRSISHQHVLPPDRRNDEGARSVAIRLLHKAAARARFLGYRAHRLTLSLKIAGRERWSAEARINEGGDLLTLIAALGRLWSARPIGSPIFVGVTLHNLASMHDTLPLFPQERHREDLAKAIDQLDRKHGRHTVYPASMHAARHTAPGGIAFTSIPDPALPDAVEPGHSRGA